VEDTRLSRPSSSTAKLLALIALVLLFTSGAWAGEKTLVNFTGANGNGPVANVVLDSSGNIYGTTSSGGPYGTGTVFRLSPGLHGGWRQNLLYTFPTANPSAPWGPFSPLVLDPAGNLYGTTYYGGTSTSSGVCNMGCGTVYRLTPTSTGPWKINILYSFRGGKDGNSPNGGVVLDGQGNVYGTTTYGGGVYNSGTVYKLTPTASGPWKETILHSFTGGNIGGDGAWPDDTPTLDQYGNIFGTTGYGGTSINSGTVFELSPTVSGAWSYSVIHSFSLPAIGGSDGANPFGGVIIDSAGNLYGATAGGGNAEKGAVFELSPNAGSWTSSVLYSFQGLADGAAADTSLVQDASGNLYGTVVQYTANELGGVYKLTKGVDGIWTESVLLSFDSADGANPWASVVLDSHNNIYGTTEFGGTSGDGVVFEITQ
jgi:uncharacterized repeat protein (TIGR03803 family)